MQQNIPYIFFMGDKVNLTTFSQFVHMVLTPFIYYNEHGLKKKKIKTKIFISVKTSVLTENTILVWLMVSS